ncbi:MAG: hypothetical protein KDD62_02455, partial [Bdellovibrionales bacterium]|nr:hypothetical protein [Bdellovibrionales bacterium]
MNKRNLSILLIGCLALGLWFLSSRQSAHLGSHSTAGDLESTSQRHSDRSFTPPAKRKIDWQKMYDQGQDDSIDLQARKAENDQVESESDDIVGSDVFEQQAYVETVLAENIKARLNNRGSKNDNARDSTNDSNDPFFTVDELAELQSSGQNGNNESNLIPGGFSSRVTSVRRPQQLSAPPTDDTQPEAEDIPEPNLYEGQARGYVMLYAMHPRARQTVEAQLNAILASEIRDVYLPILTDGTFGKDYNYIASILQRLSGDARRWITLQFYFTNGSTMRNYDRTPITAGFNKIEPRQFRNLIMNDPGTRQRFVNMVQELKPLYELNLTLHPKNRNIATVMLEDNLDEESYGAMRQLAHSVLGDIVQFYRNPCEGCYSGNDSASLGDPVELHLPHALPFLTRRDGLSLDGISYHFPWEEGGSGLSIAQVQEVNNASLGQGLQYFGIWREERQGLHQGSRQHPDSRTY